MEVQLETSAGAAPLRCRHCGTPVPAGGGEFCCNGCAFVHESLRGLGLTSYYEVLRRTESTLRPAKVAPQRFEYCDDPRFLEAFTEPAANGTRRVIFFLDGIHCAACVWLLEKIPEIEKGIVAARLAFATGELEVTYNPTETKPSRIASLVNSLGYKPTPIRSGSGDKARSASNRIFLVRIGVAAVCAMNVMMMAVSLYQGHRSGIESSYRDLFSWVSLLLALPVLTFSAWPMYRTAFGGLRAGVLHIDLPIALAVLAGFFLSALNTILGRPNIYYDSITALVFLLLISRWIQHRSLERASDPHHLLYAISPRVATKDGKQVYVESLMPGDVIDVRAGELVPVDGMIVEGEGELHRAVLTGESRPLRASRGSQAFAGTKLLTGSLRIEVVSIGSQTRLGQIMRTVEQAAIKRAPIQSYLDKVSRGFTAVVLILALFTFLFWFSYGLQPAMENSLALLVVTCPCVLAFATPLTFSLAVTRAARKGILFRSAESIERLTRAECVVFDKTGTLTQGEARVVKVWTRHADTEEFKETSANSFRDAEPDYSQIISALEFGIEHPIADALRSISAGAEAAPAGRTIVPGRGVSAQISGELWELRAAQLDGLSDSFDGTVVGLRRGGVVRALFGLDDSLRPAAKGLISALRKSGKSIYILSGDNRKATERIARELDLDSSHVYAEASPEEKSAFVAALQRKGETVMIGDGVNDAAAFKAASVGIGFQGGAEAALKVADVYLAQQDLPLVSSAFRGSSHTLRVIKRGLFFSAAYNLVGGMAAILGVIGPLGAAILMPCSSLTVIVAAVLAKPFQE